MKRFLYILLLLIFINLNLYSQKIEVKNNCREAIVCKYRLTNNLKWNVVTIGSYKTIGLKKIESGDYIFIIESIDPYDNSILSTSLGDNISLNANDGIYTYKNNNFPLVKICDENSEGLIIWDVCQIIKP